MRPKVRAADEVDTLVDEIFVSDCKDVLLITRLGIEANWNIREEGSCPDLRDLTHIIELRWEPVAHLATHVQRDGRAESQLHDVLFLNDADVLLLEA